MKGILLASLFFILTTAVGNTESNNFVNIAAGGYAWWLSAEFHPFDVEVRGIPVGKIRATWCKATEFRKDLFPPGWVIEGVAGSPILGLVGGYLSLWRRRSRN
jgi:hypothetical protein